MLDLKHTNRHVGHDSLDLKQIVSRRHHNTIFQKQPLVFSNTSSGQPIGSLDLKQTETQRQDHVITGQPLVSTTILKRPLDRLELQQIERTQQPVVSPSIPSDLMTLLSSIIPLSNTNSSSITLASLFPSLNNKSFLDVISMSSIYLKRDALAIAAMAAESQHDIDPQSVLVDRASVLEHSSIAQTHGLPTLLSHLFDELALTTLQPLDTSDSAIIEASLPGACALWATLVHPGANLIFDEDFVPSSKCLHLPIPSRDVQLAFERLNRGDQ